MPIRNPLVRSFVQRLDQSPDRTINDSNVLQLLAAVGDRSDADAQSLLGQLSRPDISRQEQLDLAKAGLDDDERADLKEILGSYELSPGACNFIEALLGLAGLGTNHGPLVLLGTPGSEVRGTVGRHDSVEVINMTTAPGARDPLDAMVTFHPKDDLGWFTGDLGDVKEGDQLRLRARHGDGTASAWISLRASGLGDKDERNAIVNVRHVKFVVKDDGSLDLLSGSRHPVSEPGAQLRFRNARSGDAVDCMLDDDGQLPAGLNLPGKPGDQIRVAVSDGTNNKDLQEIARVLKVPEAGGGGHAADPGPLAKTSRMDSSALSVTSFTGPLFIDGASPADVQQGSIGNCYFPASMAAVAHHRPQAIHDAISDNGDGTYTVRFFKPGVTRPRKRIEVLVNGDLYGGRRPSYGRGLGGSSDPDKMELWFPLIEKAYAKWKGSYQTVGKGGWAGDAMAALTGGIDDWDNLADLDDSTAFSRIKKATEQGWSMASGTFPNGKGPSYSGTGLYNNHVYSVLGCEEENGVRYIKLRNPWGSSEPGSDGKNDGFFRLELDKYMKLYEELIIVKDEVDDTLD